MKSIKKVMVGMVLAATLFSGNVFAGLVSELKIVDLHQYTDGTIFVSFDKPISSECGVYNKRAAFIPNDKNKFMMPAILTAISSQMTVDAYVTGGCPIHGNSAGLSILYLKR